jgi:hypothetical protein
MFENKIISPFLKIIPQSKWNFLSNAFARVSIPTIGSPISFNHGNFILKEFDLLESDELRNKKFLDFCYPSELVDREKEIEIDRQYWRNASTFAIYDKNELIKGCAQYIAKKDNSQIPVELTHIIDKSGKAKDISAIFNKNKVQSGSYAEIYRCRRSFDLRSSDAFSVVYMLFKALWAKIIQESAHSIYITFDANNNELYNLYIKRLCFQDPGIIVRFNNSSKSWRLLVKDCLYEEKEMASLSRTHFFMQTWFRKNLKKKNLHIRPPLSPVTARLFPENKTALFTHVVKTGKHQSRARRRILNRNRVS